MSDEASDLVTTPDRIELTKPVGDRMAALAPAALGALSLLAASQVGSADGTPGTAAQIFLSLVAGIAFALAAETGKPCKVLVDIAARRYRHVLGWRSVIKGELTPEASIEIESILLDGRNARWNVWIRLDGTPLNRFRALSGASEADAEARAASLAGLLGVPVRRSHLDLPDRGLAYERHRRKHSARRMKGRLPIFLNAPEETVRLDDEEIRTAASHDTRRQSARLLVASAAAFLMGGWGFDFLSRALPWDLPLSLDLRGWLGLLIVGALAGAGFAVTRLLPASASIRLRERTFRGMSGWSLPQEGTISAGASIVVERRKRLLGPVNWIVSLKSGQSRVRLLATQSGRKAREFVDIVSNRLLIPLIDMTGALPATAADTESPVPERHGSSETPEQRAAREPIHGLLEQHRPRVAGWRIFTIGGAVSTIVSTLAMTFVNLAGGRGDAGASLTMLCAIAMLSSLGGWYIGQHRMAGDLASIDSAAAVGPLLDLVAESSAGRNDGIRIALTKLLKQMKPADGASLNAMQRDTLRALLSAALTAGNFELLTSGLRALEQIGEERDIPVLEDLAGRVESETIRAEVKDCLTALYSRAELARPGLTLLRPAETSPDGSDLLRPAIGDLDHDTDTLLRSAEEHTYVADETDLEHPTVSQTAGL